MQRRSFLQGIFAAAMAPAIVKAENLMQVRKIILLDTTHAGMMCETGGKFYEYDGNIWHKKEKELVLPKNWSFGDPYDAALADTVRPGQSIEDKLWRSRFEGSSLSELRMLGVLT